MRAKFDMEKARQDLLKRDQESQNRKDGESGPKYFKTDMDIQFWKFGPTKEEPHLIDIIPYVVEDGSMIPFDKSGSKSKIREGDLNYIIEPFVHTNIGPNKQMILCPAKNYGRRCPICEEIDRLSDEGKEYEDFQTIYPKRRCVYNVLCYDSKREEEKGIQVWEVSWKYSQNLILSALKSRREGGVAPTSFVDLESGKSVVFEVLNDKYRTIQGLRLESRNYKLSEELVDQAYQLDQLLLELPYKEIEAIFLGGEEEATGGKAQEEAPARSRGRTREEPKKDECPYVEGAWGIEIDKMDECKKCELKIYEACGKEADRLEAEEKKHIEEEKKKQAEDTKAETPVRRRRRE